MDVGVVAQAFVVGRGCALEVQQQFCFRLLAAGVGSSPFELPWVRDEVVRLDALSMRPLCPSRRVCRFEALRVPLPIIVQ